MNNCYSVYDTPIGKITLCVDGEGITALYFGEKAVDSAERRETALAKRAAQQLAAYFAGERREFDLPLCPTGTPFQMDVWEKLREIPYGETRSYKQVAEMVGRPLACRAVGLANNRNRIPILIPCHRVVGADGSLVGYGGGLHIKVRLLELERAGG